MRISLSNNGSLKEFSPVDVKDAYELAAIITQIDWSTGIFHDNHRTKDKFIEAACIGLDIDDGMDLEQALIVFNDYKHVIGTTKSHRKDKNGKVADRFRVVLFFDTPISDADTFDATWHTLHSAYPAIDKACKDPSRFYYQCQEIVSIKDVGLLVTPSKPVVKETVVKRSEMPAGELRGTLSRSTLDFLVNGAPNGSWNALLFKAALDFNEQGYEIDEFIERAEKVTGYLDSKDSQTIDSAFSRSPKYEARIDSALIEEVVQGQDLIVRAEDLFNQALDYLGDKELVKGEPTGIPGLDKILGGGKRLGEMTVWHAEAKTGKNTLWHYLMCLWFSKGIKQGYASRELRPAEEVIPDFLSIKTGLNVRLEELTPELRTIYHGELVKCPISFAKGYGLFDLNEIRAWVKVLKADGVNYFWFDHLHYMLEDPEDHKAAAKLIKELKTLVLDENIHMDLIIQPNKLMDGAKLNLNSIKGGSAMGQALDNLIILERSKDHDNVMKITLERCRSKLGRLGSVHVSYNPENMTFEEVKLEKVAAPLESNDAGFDDAMAFKVFKGNY